MHDVAAVREPSANSQIYLYFGLLTLLVYLVLPDGYLLDIPTSYMLKNHLHASAVQVSSFRLLTAVPVYVSFVFGLSRDLWNPCGVKDRGIFFLFGALGAIALLWMALSPLTYSGLFIGMLLVMVSSRFIAAAYQGLLALVGQERLMSGRLSALWSTCSFIPWIAGAFASGYITEHLTATQTFALVAVLSLLLSLFGVWKPRAVFNQAYDQPQARGSNFFSDIKRV